MYDIFVVNYPNINQLSIPNFLLVKSHRFLML